MQRRGKSFFVGVLMAGAILGTLLSQVPAHSAAIKASATNDPNGPTGSGDAMRTGWYPNQPGLSPSIVTSPNFGQLFSQPIDGQVYGQPLVVNGTLVVATETNWVYGLDPDTGKIRWSRQMGSPWNPAELSCADLTPAIGVTSTPTVDPATGIVYLTSKSYITGSSGVVGYFMHAIDPMSGNEQPGFPVQIQGTAQNNPNQPPFAAKMQLQRPGLLLLGGVVYAAFSSHCDRAPYQGWVIGVSTAGQITALWGSEGGTSTGSGGGIWQSGGGLVSDGPNQILLATGNGLQGGSPAGSIPGSTPPAVLSESVVRLTVQTNGSLKPTDFFTPYDAQTLDNLDADFGSGAPMALPGQFGTASYPHLLFAVGKEGYVYLLNRDNLGGVGMGPGGGDAALSRPGPYGGVWSSPAAWPGDGGYVYIPTVNNPATPGGGNLLAYQIGSSAQGVPTVSKVGVSNERFGFGAGRPIVTSNSTASGTALVWTIQTSNGTGTSAQLIAYNPVPLNGTLQSVGQWPVGTASKFSQPGVGNGRIYVGTRDNHVVGFGAPVSQTLSGTPVDFGQTTVGQSSPATVTFTASAPVTVTGFTATPSTFVPGTPTPALGTALSAGQTMSVPVTFSPTTPGGASGTLTAITNTGQVSVPLSGLGLAAGPNLVGQTKALSMGGTPLGGQLSGSLTFTNLGAKPLTINSVTSPTAPFSMSGDPAPNSQIASNQTFTITVNFNPTVAGTYNSHLVVASDGGTQDVTLTASATNPSVLKISSTNIDAGTIPLGTAATRSFTLQNQGGSPLMVTKSKPPITGPFAAATQVPEGTTLPAGSTTTVFVHFVPTAPGPASDQWVLTANDGQGVQTITFTGTASGTGGAVPPPAAGLWQLNGAASMQGSSLQLTPALNGQTGSAFWPASLPSNNLTVSFDSTADAGSGADGLSLIFADPGRGAVPASLGAGGAGLGFAGIPGVAVGLDEYQTPTNPSSNVVGVTDGLVAGGAGLHWVAVSNLASPLQGVTKHVVAQISNNTLTVWVDGNQYISAPVNLPPNVLVGFGGGTGGLFNRHTVSSPVIVSGGIPSSPTTPITQLYSQMGGGAGVLGGTKTAEAVTPDNAGRFATYQGGGIWESARTGVYEVHGSISVRYFGYNTVMGVLGYPTTNETGTPDGVGRFNHFQFGSLYWTPQLGAHEIHGAIKAEWSLIGWERSVLGYPTTDESITIDGVGRFNHFQFGSIFWLPATGAHEVHGGIRAEWSHIGWERSVLGYPTTDETVTPDGIGRYNQFQFGSIYWSPASGAHEIHGGIRALWASLGWERSRLGYPTSDEYSPSPGLRRNDFQHGSITWNLANGQATVIYR